MTHYRAVVVCVMLFALPPSMLLAQTSANGSIRGHVRDEQNAVVPGVTITARSADTPGARTALSDSEGFYRLLDLAPGNYSVTAELQGFAKVVREGVIVRAGLNLGLDLTMPVGSMTETVTVKAESPLLESRNAVQAVNISGDFQRSLPITVRRNWSDFLLLTPGVVHMDDPGQGFFFHARGAQLDSNTVQVDGADVLSAQQSYTGNLSLNHDTIQDVQIKAGGVDASAPLGMGAVVTLATQSGTNQLKGSISSVWQRKGWSSDNNPGGTTTAIHLFQADLSGGGPIRRDRWWFFGSYRFARDAFGVSRRPDQINDLKALVPGFEPFNRDGDDSYVFFKNTMQLAPNHQMYAFYQYDDNVNSQANAVAALPLGWVHAGGTAVAARLSSTWGSSLTTRMLVTFNNKALNTELRSTDRSSIRIHRSTFPSGGALVGSGTIATLDNNFSSLDEPLRKLVVSGDATYFHRGWFGTHEFQAGTYLQPVIHVKYIVHYPNKGFALEERVLRDSADPAAGVIPFHRQLFDVDSFKSMLIDTRDYAFYLQDAWKPSARLTLNAGVRLDFIKRTDRLFDVVMQDTAAIGPRLGVNYLLTADGRNALRGSWGRVHETPARGSTTTAGTVSAGRRDEYDINLDGVFETVFVTPATSNLTLNREIDLKGYRQPHAREWIIGYSRQFRGEIAVDASVVRREFRDRIASVEVNAVYDGNVFRGYRNEAFNEIFLLTSNRWNWPVYTGLELQAAKRATSYQLLASYMRTFQHLAGTWQPNDPASFIQPDAFENNRGIGSSTSSGSNSLSGSDSFNAAMWRDHSARVAISASLPWRVQVATSFQYQSGLWAGPIVTRISAADPRFGPATLRLSNGRVVQNPLATTIRFAFPTRGDGQIRMSPMKVWNIRVGRTTPLGRANIEIAVDVLNILNNDADQIFDSGGNQLYSPSYGKGQWRLHPRAAQFSGRLWF